MRKTLYPLLALLLAAAPAAAQSVTIPDKVQADPGFIVIKAAAVDADALRWFSVGTPKLTPQPEFWPAPPLGTFTSLTFTPGVYRLGVIPAKAGKDGKAAIGAPQFVTVTVGTPAPPTPPVPPIPPGPTPGPAPVPDPGLHVLMIYDKAKETTLPQGQQDVLFGAQTRAYLTAKCAQVAGKADWGIWPDGGDASAYPSAPLKAMYARPRQSVPWVVISKDGAAGFEGPLPADVPAALALFSKYGG